VASKHYVAPRFVYFPELKYAQLICNKCGTWSFAQLYEQRYGHRPGYNREFAKIEDLRRLKDAGVFLAQFVRDPAERLISCYEYFKYRFQRHARLNQFFPRSPEMDLWHHSIGRRSDFSFDEFVMGAVWVFPLDKHIAQQYGTHEGMADFLWPLEDSVRGWQHIRERVPSLPSELPHANSGTRTQQEYFTEKSRKLFEDFYKDDIQWYRDVLNQAELRST
jgi:hypothetical protein